MNRITTNTTTTSTTTTKHPVDEKSKTIEQLKSIIEELQIRHERKERELLKRMGILYQDLQQSKKKMAHLIYKHQQQKKVNLIVFSHHHHHHHHRVVVITLNNIEMRINKLFRKD